MYTHPVVPSPVLALLGVPNVRRIGTFHHYITYFLAAFLRLTNNCFLFLQVSTHCMDSGADLQAARLMCHTLLYIALYGVGPQRNIEISICRINIAAAAPLNLTFPLEAMSIAYFGRVDQCYICLFEYVLKYMSLNYCLRHREIGDVSVLRQ